MITIDINRYIILGETKMLGKPKYKYGDTVKFKVTEELYKVGTIEIVDSLGTFDQKKEPSYDKIGRAHV